MGEQKPLIQQRELTELEKREIVWSVIQLLQSKNLSYYQAVELLEDTKGQLKYIPINIS